MWHVRAGPVLYGTHSGSLVVAFELLHIALSPVVSIAERNSKRYEGRGSIYTSHFRPKIWTRNALCAVSILKFKGVSDFMR
jgi:hypothetical protein